MSAPRRIPGLRSLLGAATSPGSHSGPSRPTSVAHVAPTTPPVVVHFGDRLRFERFPVGRTRLLVPADPAPHDGPPIDLLEALAHPVAGEPLAARLRPGMRLTIAFDDLTAPLPPAAAPDPRGRIIERLLDVAAEAGVDDVQLIAMSGLRRHLTEGELRRILGGRVHGAFAPRGRLANHDVGEVVEVAAPAGGHPVRLARRAVACDLLVVVRISDAPGDGWTAVLEGLGDLDTVAAGAGESATAASAVRSAQGATLAAQGPPVFAVTATLEEVPASGDPLATADTRPEDWSRAATIAVRAAATALDRLPAVARHDLTGGRRVGYRLTGLFAGDPEQAAAAHADAVRTRHGLAVRGTTDIGVIGVAAPTPGAVGSTTEPFSVLHHALVTLFGRHTGRSPVRDGGVLILSHPLTASFHPHHHPGAARTLEVLDPSADAAEATHRIRADDARYDTLLALHRTGRADHPALAALQWQRTAPTRATLGRVIVAGGHPEVTARFGLDRAPDLRRALEQAGDLLGGEPTITVPTGRPTPIAEVD